MIMIILRPHNEDDVFSSLWFDAGSENQRTVCCRCRDGGVIVMGTVCFAAGFLPDTSFDPNIIHFLTPLFNQLH
jgi:hypothetical protein